MTRILCISPSPLRQRYMYRVVLVLKSKADNFKMRFCPQKNWSLTTNIWTYKLMVALFKVVLNVFIVSLMITKFAVKHISVAFGFKDTK